MSITCSFLINRILQIKVSAKVNKLFNYPPGQQANFSVTHILYQTLKFNISNSRKLHGQGVEHRNGLTGQGSNPIRGRTLYCLSSHSSTLPDYWLETQAAVFESD